MPKINLDRFLAVVNPFDKVLRRRKKPMIKDPLSDDDKVAYMQRRHTEWYLGGYYKEECNVEHLIDENMRTGKFKSRSEAIDDMFRRVSARMLM